LLAVAAHFAHSNEGTQTAALLVMVVSELFCPLSLLNIVLTFEGLTRAVGAGINREVVPSMVVTLSTSLWDRFPRRSFLTPYQFLHLKNRSCCLRVPGIALCEGPLRLASRAPDVV
jgi:hypothetical protein